MSYAQGEGAGLDGERRADVEALLLLSGRDAVAAIASGPDVELADRIPNV